MSQTQQKIAAQLRVPANAVGYLEPLSTEAQETLSGMLEQTRQTHRKELEAGIDKASQQLPRLLRGAFMKLFKR